MKKLFLFLSISFSLHAQSDSIKVTFSEEKVEKFEKTTLIDEYEKAFGGNRVVKSGLRYRLLSHPIYEGLDVWQLQFEQKINNNYSFTIKIGGESSKNSNLAFEIKKFKKKFSENLFKPNISGDFISIFLEGTPNKNFSSGQLNSFLLKRQDYFYGLGAIGISKGKQFGNTLAFGIKGGVRIGNESVVNRNKDWIYENNSKLIITPYISSFTEVGLGILFPFKKKLPSNSCEFLNCKYEVKKMWRLNLSNLFYIDKYEMNLAGDLSFERKLKESAFSLNSEILATINYHNEFRVTGSKDTLILGYDRKLRTFQKMEFEKANIKVWESQFAINEQLRYYPGQKKRISSGKISKNLNGAYLGLYAEYRILSRYFNESSYQIEKGFDKIATEKSLGLLVGYQTLATKKAFISYEFKGGINEQSDNFYRLPLDPYIIEPFKFLLNFRASIKLGLAK